MVVVAAALSSPVLAAAPPAPQTIRYQMDLHIEPDEHLIQGTATLSFSSPAIIPTINLASQAEVSSIIADGQRIKFDRHGDRLELSGKQGQKFERVIIDYSARFSDPSPRETIGIEDPSFGVSAAILPQGTYLSAGTRWFPQIEGLRGQHRVRVTAPEGIIVITAGRLVGISTESSRTTTTWENTFPLEGLALSAGRFELAREELDGIQLLTFLSPGNSELAPAYLAAMRRHLTFYRDLLGPYPFAKFAVVENFIPTGYGMPSWTLLGSSVVRLPFILDTSLPHEIVHSWWGNAVEVDYARGNWAEGLTTYLADYLLKELDNPQEALEYRRKILRDYAALVTPAVDFPLSWFTGRTTRHQQAIGYGKGAMAFHMLRTTVGEQAFWAGLRQLAREGSQAILGWNDIERIFSTTAKSDLRWFFHQWISQNGAPSLSLANVHLDQSDSRWKITGMIEQIEPTYRLDMQLRLTDSMGKATEQTISLHGTQTLFSMESDNMPHRLVGDPDCNLFRRLDPEELPSTINDLFTPRRPLVVIAAGRESLRETAGDLLKGIHWGQAEIIDEAATTPESLTGRDVLFFGWPNSRGLQPELPERLSLAANGSPVWHDETAQRSGEVLFAVVAGRQSPAGIRAILIAAPPEAARSVAAKISHYGRYGLLLFANGRNVVKITREPPSSPLKVNFAEERQP